MNRFNIPLVAEGLTTYAIERQNGIERHQSPDGPPWADRRRFWTDAILQGMARLEGQAPDPKLIERFDYELERTHGIFCTVPASPQLQQETIQNLRCFVSALETAGGDRRRQINVVWKLLEDMSSHLPWASEDNGIDRARDEAEYALCRMTARLPICFTRILLGGDAGPHWVSGFVSGSVTDATAVQRSAVYRNALRQYPEVGEWPALCTVCVGWDLPSDIRTIRACAFDLEILNRIGDKFLNEPGVQQVYARQMTVSASPMEIQRKQEQHPLLQGTRPLRSDDFEIYERFSFHDGCLTFCMKPLADEESVFGRKLSDEREKSYVVAYAAYDVRTGQVRDILEAELRLPCDERWFHCELSPEMRESLRRKMDTFCMLTYGEHLPEPPVQRQDEPVPPQAESNIVEAWRSAGPAMG